MLWHRLYPEFRVPKGIVDLVEAGILRDTSHPEWGAPTFEVDMAQEALLILEVEHPDPSQRDFQHRYNFFWLEPGAEQPEHRIGTNLLKEALWLIRFYIDTEGPPKGGFRLLE